jgi:hypothetical protein
MEDSEGGGGLLYLFLISREAVEDGLVRSYVRVALWLNLIWALARNCIALGILEGFMCHCRDAVGCLTFIHRSRDIWMRESLMNLFTEEKEMRERYE